MLQDFKLFGTSRNERFIRGLVCGIPAAIVIGAVYGGIMHYSQITWEISYLIIGLGVAVAYVVRTTSRGVQMQFGILAALLTVLCILTADMINIWGFDIFIYGFFFCLRTTIRIMFDFGDVNAILRLTFRVISVIVAFQQGTVK